jgi:hypothetical protein
MASVLNELLNDGRLTRLFSKDARHCALQLWILQIKSEQSIENRIVYGRLADHELEELSRGAHALAMVRPMVEWRSEGAGKSGQLAAFLDQVEQLLASSGESKSKHE